MNLAEQLEEAEARADRIRRQIAAATCREVGQHDWKFIGGCNAGCGDDCGCSVPVHECRRCRDCDYGQNREADEIRRLCAAAELAR